MLTRRRNVFGLSIVAITVAIAAAILTVYGVGSSDSPSGTAAPLASQVEPAGPSGDASATHATGESGVGQEQVGGTVEPSVDDGVQETAASTVPETPLDSSLQRILDVDVDLSGLGGSLPRDAIRPIYDPQFITANLASRDPGELVIGVEINGESKAYPVGPLIIREMVNDVVGGVPLLVTW